MQRFSKNRQAILDCLRSTDSHPTAEWVYNRLKPDYPNLSLGTVYRNLSQLREAGLIRSMGVEAGEEHFDARTEPHVHAVCRCCGAIIDVQDFPELESLAETVERVTDYRITELQLRGICPECLQKRSGNQ